MPTSNNDNRPLDDEVAPDQKAPAIDIPHHPEQHQQAAASDDVHEQLPELSSDTSSDAEVDMTALSRRNTNAMMGDDDRSELVRIATALSRRRSSVAGVPAHITSNLDGIPEDDPVLNPEHSSFDLAKWIRHFIEQLRQEGYTAKYTGVSFRNLDVYGSGSAIQLQQTVGSFLMAPLRLGEFFSFGEKKHKQILHGFDGVLKSGELLVVLGRPGSGCSTLLKTITGELHGLMLGDQTNIHYNGIPLKQMMMEFKGEAIYNQEVSPDAQILHIDHLLTVSRWISISLTSRSARHSNSLPLSALPLV